MKKLRFIYFTFPLILLGILFLCTSFYYCENTAWIFQQETITSKPCAGIHSCFAKTLHSSDCPVFTDNDTDEENDQQWPAIISHPVFSTAKYSAFKGIKIVFLADPFIHVPSIYLLIHAFRL